MWRTSSWKLKKLIVNLDSYFYYPMNREETIKAISEAFKKLPDGEAYLFGSSARGDFRDDSDIDLLVLLPDNLSSNERVEKQMDICGILFPIEMDTDIVISPVMLQHKVWNQRITPFTINVMNERVKL